jgi:hypothetical protein
MKPEKLSKLRFREGEEVIFIKNMSRCRGVANYGNGDYSVQRIDNGVRLYVTSES